MIIRLLITSININKMQYKSLKYTCRSTRSIKNNLINLRKMNGLLLPQIYIYCFKMATTDMKIEAPIMAKEAETDPAAPAAGAGAGARLDSWAKPAAKKRATAKTTAKALNVVTGAIVPWKRGKVELEREKSVSVKTANCKARESRKFEKWEGLEREWLVFIGRSWWWWPEWGPVKSGQLARGAGHVAATEILLGDWGEWVNRLERGWAFVGWLCCIGTRSHLFSLFFFFFFTVKIY